MLWTQNLKIPILAGFILLRLFEVICRFKIALFWQNQTWKSPKPWLRSKSLKSIRPHYTNQKVWTLLLPSVKWEPTFSGNNWHSRGGNLWSCKSSTRDRNVKVIVSQIHSFVVILNVLVWEEFSHKNNTKIFDNTHEKYLIDLHNCQFSLAVERKQQRCNKNHLLSEPWSNRL